MHNRLTPLILILLVTSSQAQQLAVTARRPDQNAKAICVDTHLDLTFSAPPKLGETGQIRIYDAADDKLIDTLDLSVPVTQQNYVIGGNPLHAYPVIVHDNIASIYPHNNSLAYGKTYYVQVDSGVLSDGTQPFAGYTGKSGWVFSTKPAAPAAGSERITVSADGSGDFATVQGAIDWVPENNQKRVTIFLRKGVYTEIVAFIAKHNITFLGEDRKETIVAYANHNNLQPNNAAGAGGQFSGSSYRRGVFMGFNSSGVVLTNFTVRNSTHGSSPRDDQEEAILFKEVRNQTGPNLSQTIVTHMDLYSYIDTIQITGKAYLEDNYVEGANDYMWGDGPCYFINCRFRNLHDGTSYTQPRNPAGHHGFVIVDSIFDGAPDVHAAYLGNGSGATSETVLINCKIGSSVRPEGWNSRGANNAEFNTINLGDGKSYDMSHWPAFVKHFDKEKDAETIANYRNPTWVLGGWTPEIPPDAKGR